MKKFAVAFCIAVSLVGCGEENRLPSEAAYKVVYSPEISELWNSSFPSIRLGEGQRFTYWNYDVGGGVCKEYAEIDGKAMYNYISLPERCGIAKGFWRSTMITFESGKYRVYVPAVDLEMFKRSPQRFNNGYIDEFVAQFMTTAPATQCNSAPASRYCQQVLSSYRVVEYASKELPKKREFLSASREYSYYPR